jgi:hypothetical protein
MERGTSPLGVGPLAARDEMIAWSKDLSRSIDDLGTRAEVECRKIA